MSASEPTGRPITEADPYAARIYVSSAGADMAAERQALFERAGPELSRRLRSRGVALTIVDLARDADPADVERPETLRIRRREIDRSRPLFVGLIGERYGANAGAEGDGLGFLEWEARYGALDDGSDGADAVFFERDPFWTRAQRPSETFVESDPDTRARMAEFKQRIRLSRATIAPYGDPDMFAARAVDVLWAALDRRFPETARPADDQDAPMHAAYAAERRRVHLAAETALSALDAWAVQAAPPPILICGPTGSGAGALVANWVQERRTRRPQDLVVEHYAGATADSQDPSATLRRLIHALEPSDRSAPEASAAAAPSDLLDALLARASEAAAARASAGGGVVIVVDGADRIGVERNLAWAPFDVPEGVRFACTARSAAARETAAARGWRILDVAPLNPNQRRLVAGAYAARRGENGAPAEAALDSSLAGRPIFWAAASGAGSLSETTIAAETPLALYEGLFEAAAATLGSERLDACLALLAAARAGLEEPELIAAAAVSPLDWARIRDAVGGATSLRAGRVVFSHDAARDAATRRLGSSALRSAHRRLADTFADHDDPLRSAEETPHQLRSVEDWAGLEAVLLDLDRFAALRAGGDAALWDRWSALTAAGGPAPGALVDRFFERAGLVENWDAEDAALGAALDAFFAAGPRDHAAPRRRLAEARAVAAGAHATSDPAAIDARIALAAALTDDGELRGADAELRLARAAAVELDVDHPTAVAAADAHADLLLTMDRAEHALEPAEAALAARRSMFGDAHPATVTAAFRRDAAARRAGRIDAGSEATPDRITLRKILGADHPELLTRACEQAIVGDAPPEALDASAERIARMFGSSHPRSLTARRLRARLRLDAGDPAAALSEIDVVVAEQRAILGLQRVGLVDGLEIRAAALDATGDAAAADAAWADALQAATDLHGPTHPALAGLLGRLGSARRDRGDLIGARRAYEAALATIDDGLGLDHPSALGRIDDIAALSFDVGDFSAADAALADALGRLERSAAPDDSQFAALLNRRASVALAAGDSAKARSLRETALDRMVAARGPDHPETLACVDALAMTLMASGDAAGARSLLEALLEARRSTLGVDDPQTLKTEAELAIALIELGAHADARRIQERAWMGARDTLGPTHPETLARALDLGLTLKALGLFAEAAVLHGEVLDVRTETLGREHPDTLQAMDALGGDRMMMDDLAGARFLLEESAAGHEALFGPDHAETLAALGALALLRLKFGDLSGARELAARVVAGRRATLGSDHPHTAIAIEHLESIDAEFADREAEARAEREAEERAQREAEEQARREAEEQARREAEEQARREAAEQARREAEEQARREAEEQARREAEQQARREAEERAQREAEAREARKAAKIRALRAARLSERLPDDDG